MREQMLYAQAFDACQRAELALGEQPEEDVNDWWAEWLEVQVGRVWANYWLAQWPEMEALVHKLQLVVQEHGSATSRMRLLWASCMMHMRRDRYVISPEMLADGYEGLALSQEWGNLKTRIEWQFELGFLHLWRRELVEAEKNFQTALELTETSGFVYMRILTLIYLTVLNRFRGLVNGVLDHVLLVQGAAEAAHMPDYVAAAKGNQAWLAWRRRDLPAAEQRGQEALALWRQSPLVYPFRWQALWPLIAVALEGEREDEAWVYIQALLEPTQQRLPEGLNTSLEAALQARTKGQFGAALLHLNRAIELAQEMGYL